MIRLFGKIGTALKNFFYRSRTSIGLASIWLGLKGLRSKWAITGKREKRERKASFNFLKLSFRKKLAAGVITAIVAVGGIFLYFQTRVGATTYTWLQETWSGGADLVNFPRHGVNQTGWTKYYSKDTQINTSNDELKIAQTDTNWTETDDASGFSSGTKSNTYSSGTGVLLKKNNGVSCTTAQTTDYECTSANCDADFSSGNYCHATVSSCVDFALGTPWERANTYNLCSGNSYYKNCANSVWGNQQNNLYPINSYCNGGGGAQSDYRLAATCTSGIGGGFSSPSCGPPDHASCSPYMAASTSSCYTNCATDDNAKCWTGYHCYSGNNSCQTNANGGSCDLNAECTSGYCNASYVCAVNPWISGYCSVQVYYADVSGTKQWKTTQTNCDTPQCGIDGGQDGDNLVASNSVDFSLYPARDACKTLGGRLPTKTELQCIYTNRASLGSFQSFYYWSSTEYNAFYAWSVNFASGNTYYINKTYNYYARCVR